MALRQEINMLSHKRSKGKVLDHYLKVINSEKAKLNKQAKKAKKTPKESDSAESDSDISIAVIEQEPEMHKKRKLANYLLKQQIIKDNEKTEEEIVYLKNLHIDNETESDLSHN